MLPAAWYSDLGAKGEVYESSPIGPVPGSPPATPIISFLPDGYRARRGLLVGLLLLTTSAAVADVPILSGVPANATVQCLNDVPNGLITVVGACPIAVASNHSPGDVVDLLQQFPNNALALDLGGAGQVNYRNNIINGYQGTLSVGNLVDTALGNHQGSTSQGFNQRLTINPIVIFPAVDLSSADGVRPVAILGFFVAQVLGSNSWSGQIKILSAATSPANVIASSSCSGSVRVAFSETQMTSTLSCSNLFTRTWTATDACSNTAVATQTIVLADTTPPSITCPPTVTVNAGAGQCTASNVSLGSPTTSDNCFGKVSVGNNAPSAFPKGTNSVIWTATDSCGNSATCTQKVIVMDNQPPVIGCPGNILTNSLDGNGVILTFTASAADNCNGGLPVNCTPPPASAFSIGTTPVNCTAVDSSGNHASCAFNVIVAVDPASFHIISIAPQDNDILLSWIMPLGFSGIVQAAGGIDGELVNSFTDISAPYLVPGTGFFITNYLDVGAATNWPARFYRIRLVP